MISIVNNGSCVQLMPIYRTTISTIN